MYFILKCHKEKSGHTTGLTGFIGRGERTGREGSREGSKKGDNEGDKDWSLDKKVVKSGDRK